MNDYTSLTEKQKELIYRAIFKESFDPKFIIDRDGTILDANTVFCDRINRKKSNCLGTNAYSLLTPEISAKRKHYADKAFQTGETTIFEDERNGQFFRHLIYPIAGDNGRTAMLYIMVQDISEAKRTELKSKKHAAFSQQAMDAFPGAFAVLDSKGNIISCNSYLQNLISSSKESDLYGLNTFELFHPEDKQLAYEKLKNILQKGVEETTELRIRLHGGPEYRWFRISTKLLVIDNELFLVSSGTDIDEYKKTERQLTLSNEQLRFILAESKVGSWKWDIKTNTNTWSDEIWGLYGLELHAFEPSYECWIKTIFEEDREKTEQAALAALKNGAPFKYEWRVRHPDGSLRWIMTRGLPQKNSDGDVSSYIGIVIDITDLKETEIKLKASEERFRKLFEDHASALLIIDSETYRIINANTAATRFYGWTFEKMSSMSFLDISTSQPDDLLDKKQAILDHEQTQFSAVHQMADGSLREVELFCNLSNLSEKTVYVCMVNDVTERNKARKELLKNKLILDTALESMSDAVFISDLDGSFIELNEAFARFHRFKNKKECLKNLSEYQKTLEIYRSDGSLLPLDQWSVPRALRGENGIGVEYGLKRKDTGEQWVGSYNFAPIRDPKSNIIGAVVTARDITHLKEAENALKESEERFRNFFEKHSAVMMILDPETGNIVDVNNAAAEYYGWSVEQLRRMNVIEMNIDKPEMSRKRLEVWKSARKRTFTVTHRKADGSLCDIEVYGKKIQVKGQWLAFLILHDITEQKQFQQELVKSNERMHYILDAANAGMWETNLETRESKWSNELWQLYGIEPNSFKPSLEKWLNTIIPEDRPAIERSVKEAIKNSAEFNDTWRIADANGAIRWVMSKGNPVKNEDGKVIKYAGITIDITARKRMEEENSKLESRVRRSERIETLGNLAGGIAHDFNNILTPILSYAEMGMIEMPKKEPSHEYFKQIMLAAERAQNLVYQILTFSKARDTKSSSVTIQSVIEEALKLLRPSIPSTISIEKRINPSCRPVFADPSKIYQVILNLCTNAYQAMEENGGTLSIDLDEVMANRDLIRKFPELHEQPYVQLTISDTGHGMDNKTIDRIFEPFFTTKAVNKGTGLGLSVVHGIITGYNGVINVESKPEQGTTFQIYLPVSTAKPVSTEKKKVTSNKTASILLVDDEEPILEVMSMMLSQSGYKVQTFPSPCKALEHCQQSPGAFDIVITDLTMPEMTGVKLASELYASCPALPVILMTGYEKGIDIAGETEKNNIVRLLKKPVRFDTLIAALNEALGTAKSS